MQISPILKTAALLTLALSYLSSARAGEDNAPQSPPLSKAAETLKYRQLLQAKDKPEQDLVLKLQLPKDPSTEWLAIEVSAKAPSKPVRIDPEAFERPHSYTIIRPDGKTGGCVSLPFGASSGGPVYDTLPKGKTVLHSEGMTARIFGMLNHDRAENPAAWSGDGEAYVLVNISRLTEGHPDMMYEIEPLPIPREWLARLSTHYGEKAMVFAGTYQSIISKDQPEQDLVLELSLPKDPATDYFRIKVSPKDLANPPLINRRAVEDSFSFHFFYPDGTSDYKSSLSFRCAFVPSPADGPPVYEPLTEETSVLGSETMTASILNFLAKNKDNLRWQSSGDGALFVSLHKFTQDGKCPTYETAPIRVPREWVARIPGQPEEKNPLKDADPVEYFISTKDKYEHLNAYHHFLERPDQVAFAFRALDRLLDDPQRPSLGYMWKLNQIHNFLKTLAPSEVSPAQIAVCFRALKVNPYAMAAGTKSMSDILEKLLGQGPGADPEKLLFENRAEWDAAVAKWEKWFAQNVRATLRLPDDPADGHVEITVQGPPSTRIWTGAFDPDFYTISLTCKNETCNIRQISTHRADADRFYGPMPEGGAVYPPHTLTARIFQMLLERRDEQWHPDQPWQLRIRFTDLAKIPGDETAVNVKTGHVLVTPDYRAKIPERYREKREPPQDIPAPTPQSASREISTHAFHENPPPSPISRAPHPRVDLPLPVARGQ